MGLAPHLVRRVPNDDMCDSLLPRPQHLVLGERPTSPTSMPRKPRLLVNANQARYDVFIGRPTIWGNPYVAGVHGTKRGVVEKYRESLPRLRDGAVIRRLPELRGKVLGCPCGGRPCHGEVLVELANAPESTDQWADRIVDIVVRRWSAAVDTILPPC